VDAKRSNYEEEQHQGNDVDWEIARAKNLELIKMAAATKI
jgi:hypothetical protein